MQIDPDYIATYFIGHLVKHAAMVERVCAIEVITIDDVPASSNGSQPSSQCCPWLDKVTPSWITPICHLRTKR